MRTTPTTGQPRILYLCDSCPYGEAYGGALRARLIGEGLLRAGRVTLVPVSLTAWPEHSIQTAKKRFDVTPQVRVVHVRKRLSRRLLRTVSSACVNTDDRTVSPADRAIILELAKEASLVWVEEIGIANAVGVRRWERAVLDADDLKSRYFRASRMRQNGMRWARATWLSHMWRRRERRFLERFDRVVACSEDDRDYLGSSERLRVVPNTFDHVVSNVVRSSVGVARFGFVGTIGYEPNRDAVRWFAREIMPIVSSKLPGSEFRVVGRGSTELLREEKLPGIALGYLADPTDEMATWSAMVVPIRFGGGTRIKIAEAFARRIPVVSTSLGAFGYAVADARELLLADSPEAFASACVSVATDGMLAARLTASASDCLSRQYSAESIRERVRSLACEVIDTDKRSVLRHSA